ncbi:hypothetical protein CDL15_Pgr015084 [Punica granatum]|uniref:Uncharacterized protein n=1 Tax=Punica granatum TaxID=22663 RepID=A0A218WZD4_PUNGR|nr:hypothetical protein CDL15_Pgr015084 [Punica granatum]
MNHTPQSRTYMSLAAPLLELRMEPGSRPGSKASVFLSFNFIMEWLKRMAVKISSVRFAGFYGTSLDRRAISLNCSQTIGCTNINLDNVNITAATPSEKPYASCINAHGMAYNTSPPVPCLIH